MVVGAFALVALTSALVVPPRAGRPILSAAAPALSGQLLDLVAPTDRGVAAKPELRKEIDGIIKTLEDSWVGQDANSPSQRDNLLRRTEVVYVGQSSSVKANAAGGKYRGRVGRTIFRTDTLFQHVLEEEQKAVNMICFRLFGLFKGCAVLPGVWSQKPDRRNAVEVKFEPPRVACGPLNLKFGPPSEVTLDVTYLDETIRICRGARNGTPFVFRADTCQDGAPLEAMSKRWEDVVATRPLGKPPVVVALLAAALGSWRAGCGSVGVPRAAMWLCAVVCTVAAGMVLRSTGGIVQDSKWPNKTAAPSKEEDAAVTVAAVEPSSAGAQKWTADAMKQVKRVTTAPSPPPAAVKEAVVTVVAEEAVAEETVEPTEPAVEIWPEPVIVPDKPKPAPFQLSVPKMMRKRQAVAPPPPGYEWGGTY